MQTLITMGINSVPFRGSILWNSINNDIKTAENLNVFKRITKEWNGDKCIAKYVSDIHISLF